MKLHATVADYQTDVALQRQDSRVRAEIGDRRYEIDVHESGDGGYLLISNGRVFECRVDGLPESGKTIDVLIGSRLYAVKLVDPKRLRGTSSLAAHGDGAVRIMAPMPGKIVRVMVEIGEKVEAGAGVIVVEAMKMQNEMKSPRAGTIVALNAEPGATVNAGDVLAVIE